MVSASFTSFGVSLAHGVVFLCDEEVGICAAGWGLEGI